MPDTESNTGATVIAPGGDGLVVSGTTGESPTTTDDETTTDDAHSEFVAQMQAWSTCVDEASALRDQQTAEHDASGHERPQTVSSSRGRGFMIPSRRRSRPVRCVAS